MAIEKGLYAAPTGLEDELAGMGEEALDPAGLEIDLMAEGPMMVELEDGSVEITFGDEAEDELGIATAPFDANLADYLDEDALQSVASDVLGLVDADIDSRKEWADTFVAGLDALGFKNEERTRPWEGACNVHSTVLSEAAIRFQAETMSEVFPSAGPVKTKILGEETKDKLEAAERVRADMNYELTENMVEYRPEHERLLYALGLSGSAFKKVYFDPTYGRQVAIFLPAEDVVVPYGASHIETAERITHIMRKTKNEMRSLQASGFYRDVHLGDPAAYFTDIQEKKAEESGYTLNDDDRYTLFEVHMDMCLEDIIEGEESDDIPKPYVVTIEKGTGEVLSIRRNWDESDTDARRRQHFVHYVYVPGFGFYGLGLIHIVGGYARAGTSLIRQLVDSGTLANLPGGLKSRGLRIKGDDEPIEPGEWKDVDVPSGSIRDNIMPLPYKEPSQTLLALLDRITQEGRRLGAIADMNISDMSANAPVGTTLALLERTLKPMAAVQARVHYAMKQEFKLLKQIMAENAPMEYAYIPARGDVSARIQDYMMVEVIPVSDPNSSTMAQRVVQYQAVLQMAQQAPQIYDLPQLHRQMIEVMGIKNAEKLIPMAEDTKPADPVSENMNALIGKPIKAFIHQDHEAHIAAHQSFMQDPMIAQTIGQNPQAQQIMMALQSHIAEHLGFRYRQQMEEKLGVPLNVPNEELPEDVEVQLSRLIADGGKQLTQAHQQQAAQQQAQQQAQDPMFQLQQAELQLKQAELQRKAAKDQADIELRRTQLQRDSAKDLMDSKVDAKKVQIDEAKVMLDAKKAKANLDQQKGLEESKLSMEAARMFQQGANTKTEE
jgi:hypothetical protein